jgi:hypothetical protein
MMSNPAVRASGAAVLAGEQGLAITRADASRVYRDLSAYRTQLVLEEDGWHVDHELKDPGLNGGSLLPLRRSRSAAP